MANRPLFLCGDGITNFYEEQICSFEYYNGFALSQKQKSIRSLHANILNKFPNKKILEVSRRSENQLGICLSAFNLLYPYNETSKYPVECIFQSSKVFENDKNYKDLLFKSPKEAKTDERIRNSGKLKKFILKGEEWEIEPKTLFYDYIYITALANNKKICQELINYDIFTDIEFNPQKSLNCQARSVAIAVTLLKANLLETYLNDKTLFKSIYTNNPPKKTQLSLF